MRVGDKIEVTRTEEGYELIYRWKVKGVEMALSDIRRDLCMPPDTKEIDMAKHGHKPKPPKK